MDINDPRYSQFYLVKEMYETVEYIKNFDARPSKELFLDLPGNKPIMLTGEGSSRIFPARNSVYRRLASGEGPQICTESSTDLRGKNLDEFIVIGASNSGKTRELVNLFRNLDDSGHNLKYGLSCNRGTLLEDYAKKTFILETGVETAVAASKSVVAQALFYDALLSEFSITGKIDTVALSSFFRQALDTTIDSDITDIVCKAEMVYFAGHNNGVAEELTLKTNEIIRKKSAFLPGTYLLHGVEEVMSQNDVIIMVDAYPDEYQKIKSIYHDSVGTPVIVISENPSPFHTVMIPKVSEHLESYVKLAAGWNLLVEAGIRLGVNIDKPERARKIGNEANS
jgi:glutamine---fructose-6-phosphate transaminase (isomerizing)